MIGGTMGLLTGFSILSGVEIIFFLIKLIFKCVKDGKEMLATKRRWNNVDDCIKIESGVVTIFLLIKFIFMFVKERKTALTEDQRIDQNSEYLFFEINLMYLFAFVSPNKFKDFWI